MGVQCTEQVDLEVAYSPVLLVNVVPIKEASKSATLPAAG